MVLLKKKKKKKKNNNNNKKLFLFEFHFLTSVMCRLADKKNIIK